MTRHNDVPAGGDSEEPEATTALEGAALNMMFVRAALRRKRWLWVGTAVLGLLLAAGMNLHRPVKFSAVTRINMAPSSTAPPDIAIADDVSLLKTNQVAARAVADGKLGIIPEALGGHYKGAAIGDSIVQITTTAPSYPLAAQWANALAKAFLAVQANVQGQTLQLQMNEYQGDLTALNAQISNLTNQIGGLTPAAPAQPTSQQSASIQNFTNERVSDIQQVNTLTTEINTVESSLTTLKSGNVIVDKATPAAVKSRKKVMITDSIAGLIGGLGLGVGIVVVGAVLTDRLRRRDEIAIAVGAPVELSIGRYSQPRFLRKWRLDRRVRRPSREMRMVERRMRAHLESAPGSALAVVPIECSEPAALAMASLALSLGREGRRVIVADLADGRPLQSLLERHSATGALGDVELDAASEPRRSLLARFEERRHGHVERRRPPRTEERRMSRSERRRLSRARVDYLDYPEYPASAYGRPRNGSRTVRPVITPSAIRAPIGSWSGWDFGPERPPQRQYYGDMGRARSWGAAPMTNPHAIRAAWSAWDANSHDPIAEIPAGEAPSPWGQVPQPEDVGTPIGDAGHPGLDENGAPDAPRDEHDVTAAEQPAGLSRIDSSPAPMVPGSVTVVAGPDDPAKTGVHRSDDGVDAVLVLATVDPAFGAAHIASWATEAVVMVAAGEASATRVLAAGQMLRSAGVATRAAVVVGAERDDETFGMPLEAAV